MRYIVFLIIFFLWRPILSQKYTLRAYELIFRFDTARAYPGVKKIKHTTFIEDEKIKHRSAKLILNNNGQCLVMLGPIYSPFFPSFLLENQFANRWKADMVAFKKDSLSRYTMQTFLSSAETNDSTKFYFQYSINDSRPTSIKEYQYVSSYDTTWLTESIELEYLPAEIIVKYPHDENNKLHYKFNQLGNLIELSVKGLCKGCHLVFLDKIGEEFALSDVPIEFEYEYDEKGRVTAMYETTGGERELLFRRKYIER